MPTPTLRTLARSLGLSRTTVSEALRGSPRVRPDTARRVRTAADAAGYRHNPLAGAVMSELRRSRCGMFRGVLAAVDLDEPDRPSYAVRYHGELIRGATERAGELGFKVELFVVGRQGVSLPRLDTILKSRGIQGIVLLPAWGDPEFSALDWPHYAGVYTDYIIRHPALHSVCPDHYRSMIAVMEKIDALGYRRPGLFLQKHHDERLQYRWSGAFLAYRQHRRGLGWVPPFFYEKINRAEFTDWFTRYKPDVVVGHRAEVMAWMRAAGARIPQTHGFVCLNVLMQRTACAGLDQQPRLIGARGAELVIAQLYHNERGVPGQSSLTAIPSRWVDGPTLRSAAPAGRVGARVTAA